MNIVAEIGWNCSKDAGIQTLLLKSGGVELGRDINCVPEVYWSILAEKGKASTAAEVSWLFGLVCRRVPEISWLLISLCVLICH